MKTKVSSLILCSTFAAVLPGAFAQVQDVRAGLAKSVWTAEAIRAMRASRDYKGLLTLVVTDTAAKANAYPSADALKQAIAKAQELAQTAPSISLDPDLNPTTFREMLQQLQNSNILPKDVLNDLIRELTRSAAEITDEDAILGEATVASKATFASFMQQHIMAVYDVAADARIRPILANPIGATTLPDVQTDLVTLITQSHLPDGDVKAAVLEIANSGTLDAQRLSLAASNALQSATGHFDEARGAFQAIVSGQPRFDTILSTTVPQAIQDRLAAANKLISTAPDQLEQFDTLRTVANLLPLPPAVSNTIQTVAQIGSTIESTVSTVSQVASSLSALGNVASIGMSFFTTGGIGALAGSLGSVFGGGGPSNQEILDAVNRVSDQVKQMHREMSARFDQVDRQLTIINAKLDSGFATLGVQLADIHVDLRTVVATTSTIERTILEDRDTLQRAVINDIGHWNDDSLKELHRNLVKLRSAVDRADAHSDDLTRQEYRELISYFTTLAKSEARQSPLNGFDVTDDYSLSFAAGRLSQEPNSLYAVNYAMSFPLGGTGSPTLQSMLTGPEALRDVSAQPYVNERVWAIAASAIAIMVERWPAFANEIPSHRDGYDSVVNNGIDLLSLAKAVQAAEAIPSKPLSKAYSSTLQFYQTHIDALRAGLRKALSDEARSYATTQGLDQRQAAALTSAFFASTVSALGAGRTIDAVTDGTVFVADSLSYTPPALTVTGCTGESVSRQISGTPLRGPGIGVVDEGLVLNTGVLSACITIQGFVSQRVVRVHDHGGYGIVGQGAPCAADTDVKMMTLEVDIKFMFRLSSDPDDAAHRVVIAESMVNGPETETDGTIVGQPHWSGQPTEEGHDWNSECHNPNAWHIGDSNGFYIGDSAYINNNWNSLSAGFSESSFVFQFETFAFAAANRNDVLGAMRDRDRSKLLAIYANLFSDLTAVLHQPAPAPQARINDFTSIVNEVKALEGLRALLRTLTTIGYERTLSRDDVLSGLLFGTDSLPGGADLLQVASICDHGHTPGEPDSCLADFINSPSVRAKRLGERLSLTNADLTSGKLADSHKLVDVTLDHLSNARCLVPQTFDGRADCDGQQ